MNKMSIGAAMAVMLTAPAYADSSVQLYGAIDSGLLFQNTSAASYNLKAPNTGKEFVLRDGGLYSSIWGLIGNEDLGGGYATRFKLQGAFNSANGKLGLSDTVGGSAIFNQVATVGITGPFGSIDLGRQIAPMAFALAATDVRAASNFGSIRTAWNSMNYAAGFSGSTTNKIIGGLFDSNAIVYRSPAFGGASLGVEYAPGGVAGSPQSGTRESVVVNYSNYGLNVAGVYYEGHDTTLAPGATPTGRLDNRYVYLGMKYTIRGFEVSASVSNGKNPARSNQVNFDLYSAGIGYRFTPALQVTAGMYYIKDNNNSANKSTAYSTGIEYQLSKRTLLYGEIGHVDNRGLMNQEIAYTQPVAPGKSTTTTMLGLRHNF
jgi:Outer membrane protein (porin)